MQTRHVLFVNIFGIYHLPFRFTTQLTIIHKKETKVPMVNCIYTLVLKLPPLEHTCRIMEVDYMIT